VFEDQSSPTLDWESGDATPIQAPVAGLDGDLLLGKRLAHYEIRRLLGKGGMGVVYYAFDHRLRRDVAVKVLPRELTTDPVLLRRFLTEARASAQLNHPHVVGIHAIDQQQNVHFIVMEFIDGGDLAERLSQGGPLSVREATAIMQAAASALAAAHSRKIFHRDIKPANIMFTQDGMVKVADFGLAKIGQTTSGLTTQGTVMGTPLYMSPEQCQGRQANARSDVYSLGATYFAMLTGQPPFTGDSSVAVMFQQVHEPAPDLREYCSVCPEGVSQLVAKCLAKKPDDRFQDAAELLQALEDVVRKPEELVPTPLRFSHGFYSRTMDPEVLERHLTARQALLGPGPSLGLSLPGAPTCRLLVTKSDGERVAPLRTRNLSRQRLAAAKRALDSLAFGRRGLPSNLSQLVYIARAIEEPVIQLRLVATVGVLEFQVDAAGIGTNEPLPEGACAYGPGEHKLVLVDELIQRGGNFFDLFGPRSPEQAEESRPIAVLSPEPCQTCQAKGTLPCECDKGMVVHGLDRQQLEVCTKCGGRGVRSCQACGGSGGVRPVVWMRRILRRLRAEESRCRIALEPAHLRHCHLDKPFFHQQFAFPTGEDLRQRFSDTVKLLSSELKAHAEELNVAGLIDRIEADLREISEEARNRIDHTIPDRFDLLFHNNPACGPGLVEGPTTTRYLQAELTIAAGFVDRIEVLYDSDRFEVLVMPDGSVFAEELLGRVKERTRQTRESELSSARRTSRVLRYLGICASVLILVAAAMIYWLLRSGRPSWLP